MREIKFRGISIFNGKFEYGGLVPFYPDKGEAMLACFKKHEKYGYLESPRFVKPETVGQFTGLHDKNGKEIYEGDVTKDSTGLCLVTWNPLFACFCLRRNGWAFDHFFGEAVDPFNCELLGNIHENPELLNAH